MIRTALALAIGASIVLAPAVCAAEEVAGRPTLTTKSTKELLAQREKWGTKPAQSTAKSK